MREVMDVCANEWMKLVHRKRLWLVSVFALLVVGLFAFGSYQQARNLELYGSPQGQMDNVRLQLRLQEGYLLHHPSAAVNMKMQIMGLKEQIVQLREEITAATAKNWKPAVRQQIKNMQTQIAAVQQQARSGHLQPQYEEGPLLQLQYNVAHNIRPLPSWKTSAYIQGVLFLDPVAKLFLPLLVVILVADMISGEATSGTIKLLLVRPLSRTKILLGKWLVSLFATTLLTVGLCAAILLAGVAVIGPNGGLEPQIVGVYYTFVNPSGITNGFQGGFAQGMMGAVPIPHYGHAVALPYWEFFLFGALFLVFAMWVVATIAFFCSEWFKSSVASTAASLGIVIVGFILMSMGMQQKWVVWLFPTHLNLLDDWTGQIDQMTHSNVPQWLGLTILGAWAVVAFVGAWAHFSRKDILSA